MVAIFGILDFPQLLIDGQIPNVLSIIHHPSYTFPKDDIGLVKVSIYNLKNMTIGLCCVSVMKNVSPKTLYLAGKQNFFFH